jgi:hypothetical protein
MTLINESVSAVKNIVIKMNSLVLTASSVNIALIKTVILTDIIIQENHSLYHDNTPLLRCETAAIVSVGG